MKTCFISFLLLLSVEHVHGQFYQENEQVFVFIDEANIREAGSLNAKVIGVLKQGKKVTLCYAAGKADTINGVIGHWISVLYDGNHGYIWSNTLADKVFIHNNGNTLLVKNDSKGIVFKVMNKDSLINKGTYPDLPLAEYSYTEEVRPWYAIKENFYFKLGDSDIIYAFDGVNVVVAEKAEKEHINCHHQAAHEPVGDSISSIINSDKVNFREGPTLNARVMGKLPKYTFVEVVEQHKKWEEINGKQNNWYKIKWKGKVGYVWGESISIPKKHIYDNDDKATTYLLCNNGVFVFVNKKIVANYIFDYEQRDDVIYSFGDLGYGKNYDFIVVEYWSHTCGQWGGDVYYLWDGKTIKYFCSCGGIGDGEFSEGENCIFPSDHNGVTGKVIKNAYSYESIGIIPVDECEQNYTQGVEYTYSSTWSYNGDSLVEVVSKDLKVKQFIKREFPKFMLAQYKFADVNADSVEDVVFQIKKKVPLYDSGRDGEYTYRTAVGIALGKVNGDFEIYGINEHIVLGEDRMMITLKDSMVIITTYSGYFENNEGKISGYGRKMYCFSFHLADKEVYWDSIKAIDESGLQELKFKKKKVVFKDAWSFSYGVFQSNYDE